MQTLSVTSTPMAQPGPNTQLQGQWRVLVQLVCGGVAALALVLFAASLPINFAIRSVVCATPPCLEDQLGPAHVQSLHAAGLTLQFYATYVTGLEVALVAVYTTCAVVIALRKPADWLALFVALMLVCFGAITFANTTKALTVTYPAWWWAAQGIAWFGDVAIMIFFCIFPTGRFVPRGMVIILLLWTAIQGGRYIVPNSAFDSSVAVPTLYNIAFQTLLISGFLAQIYRYRYVSHLAQRQQTK